MDPIDLATQWPFTNADLTRAVNILPNMYGRVRELNVFGSNNYIGTTMVEVQLSEGVLTLLPVAERGAPGGIQGRKPEKSIIFKVPHIPHYGQVRPADIQNKRRPGTTELQTIESVTDDKLLAIRNSHAITLEFLRMGALKGIILDAFGETIYDLYEEFDITPKVVNFALGTPTTDVAAKCRSVVRYIEDNLKGEVMSGAPRVLVDGDFMDALIGHPNVEKFYINWQAATQLTGNDPRKGFQFGGLIFEEYRASASTPPDEDGEMETIKFIESGEGHAFPMGTMNTFETHFSPADTINTANMPPDAEVFISQKILDHGKGIELYSESDPLPLVKRPALLVKVTA